MREMSKANTDLVILQEAKFTNGVYTRGLAGYIVVATYAPIRHRSGVAVFYQTSPLFAVEDVHQFGPNAVGFQMETGEWKGYIVVCYLAPDEALTIDSVVAALKERLRVPKC